MANSNAKLDSTNQSDNNDDSSIEESIKSLQSFLSEEEIKSIKKFFIRFSVNLRKFEDFEDIVKLHGGLIYLLDSLTVKGMAQLEDNQTVEQFISHLEYLYMMANKVTYSKRIGFMRETLDVPNKNEILFCNVFTEEKIRKRYRKLASYFHPDKTGFLNIPEVHKEVYIKLGTELFKYILEYKNSLSNLKKAPINESQTLNETRANEFWELAIDYRNAYKSQWSKLKQLKREDLNDIPSEELKRQSNDNAMLAYEEYRAACKIADRHKNIRSQIKLRGYMALSLYISDKFVEAQLYALSAINLVFQNSTNTTQQDLYDAKVIFDKVKCGNPIGNENIQLNTDIKPKDNLYVASNALAKTESYVNEYSFFEKKSIHRSIYDDLEKISTELMLKADRGLVRYQANKEEILQAKQNAKSCQIRGQAMIIAGSLEGGGIVAMAGAEGYAALVTGGAMAGPIFGVAVGIGLLIFGLYSGYKLMNRGNELLKEPKIRENLNEIMKNALFAYDKGEYQKFFDELSKEYKSESKILNLNHRGDSVDHKLIIDELIDHGFRADGIAYILILISEVLISGKIKIHGITTEELKTQGYLVLNGVLSDKLENEARNLDDRIQKLRKNSMLSKYMNKLKDFLYMKDYSRIAQEYKDDRKKMPFVTRLEEMRNIARINLTIRDILNNGPEEIDRAKVVIEEIRNSIKCHYEFIGMAEKRLEALEDLLWIVSGESAKCEELSAIDY